MTYIWFPYQFHLIIYSKCISCLQIKMKRLFVVIFLKLTNSLDKYKWIGIIKRSEINVETLS